MYAYHTSTFYKSTRRMIWFYNFLDDIYEQKTLFFYNFIRSYMYILKTLSHTYVLYHTKYHVYINYIHTRVFIAFCNHTETKKVFFLLPFPYIFDFNFSLS